MNDFNITDQTSFLKANVLETLRTIPDPELNINIVDLGLVYGIEIDEAARLISITMTLSSKHCPMGSAILGSVKNGVSHHFKEYTTEVILTWEPEWNYDRITEEGLRQLNGH